MTSPQLETDHVFGSAVSLNADGRLVSRSGRGGDDGADNGTAYAGAVYLFSFTDSSFSGGRLAATVGARATRADATLMSPRWRTND